MPAARETPGRFTIVREETVEAVAALTLSNGAYGLLLDWLRGWNRVTHNGQHPRAISFVWSSIKRRISRDAFDSHRQQLEEHGFIKCVHRQSGQYVSDDRWRTWQPDLDTDAALRRQYQRQEHQREATHAHRSSAGKTSTATAETVAGKARNEQCGKKPQRAVLEKPAHTNTQYSNTSPLPPSESASTIAPQRVGVGGRGLHDKKPQTAPWPPPPFAKLAALITWANEFGEFLSEEQKEFLKPIYERLEYESRHPLEPDPAAFDSMSDDEFLGKIAADLGDASAWARARVVDAVAKHGRCATFQGARELLRDGTAPEKRLKFLMHRARKAAAAGTEHPRRK